MCSLFLRYQRQHILTIIRFLSNFSLAIVHKSQAKFMKHVTYAIAALAALPQVGKGIPNFLSNFSAIRVLIDSYSCHTQTKLSFYCFLVPPRSVLGMARCASLRGSFNWRMMLTNRLWCFLIIYLKNWVFNKGHQSYGYP